MAPDSALTRVDASIDPCLDFSRYACNPDAPPGRLQAELEQDTDAALRRYLDGLLTATAPSARASTTLLREVYRRCTDPKARELGRAELRKDLDRIAKLETLAELARELGGMRATRLPQLIALWPYWEASGVDAPIVGRLSLAAPTIQPDRYRSDKSFRDKVRAHWRWLAAFEGSVGAAEVDAALRVDEWLANARVVDDGSTQAKLVTGAALSRSKFPWLEYLSGAGLSATSPLRPASVDALEQIDDLTRFSLQDLKSYLRLSLLEHSDGLVDASAFQEDARFQHELTGEDGAFDLHDACSRFTACFAQPWLAESYLATLVSPASEKRVRRVFRILRGELLNMVGAASWMDVPSRAAALRKASATTLTFLGDIPPHEAVDSPPGSFRAIALQLYERQTRKFLADIGRPQGPPDLYANWNILLYSSSVNSIWVSPRIARPPFLEVDATDAVTFGMFGASLGHEVAHTLSVTGHLFDENGFERAWWSPTANAGFDERIARMERQLESFGGPEQHLDGHRIVDEFSADLVGVQLALRALASTTPGTLDDDLRRSQLRTFFVAYAQTYCGGVATHYDPDDPDQKYPPPAVRVNGVLANVPEFADAFSCRQGTPLAPKERLTLW